MKTTRTITVYKCNGCGQESDALPTMWSTMVNIGLEDKHYCYTCRSIMGEALRLKNGPSFPIGALIKL